MSRKSMRGSIRPAIILLTGIVGLFTALAARAQEEKGAEKAATKTAAPTATAPARPAIVDPKEWKLNTADGAEAKVEPIPNTRGGMKINIDKAAESGKPWTVQVVNGSLAIEDKRNYRVTFLAKAASPRKMVCAVGMNKDPWTTRGLYTEVNLTDQWQVFNLDFTGTADDPAARLVFEVGSNPAAVDIADVSFSGNWRVLTTEDSTAELFHPVDMPRYLRVKITKLGATGGAGRVQLTRAPIAVEKGKDYVIAFQGKAKQPRSIKVAASKAVAPYTALGIYQDVKLTDAWQPFSFTFKATETESNGRLFFDLGDSDAAVELSDVSFAPDDWKLFTNAGAEATMYRPLDSKDTIRVGIRKVAGDQGWHVQLVKSGVAVEKGSPYVVRFLVRADKPRAVKVAVGRSAAPYEGLGLYKEIQVDNQWQAVEVPFEATESDPNARIYFDLGDNASPVEFKDILIEPGVKREGEPKAEDSK